MARFCLFVFLLVSTVLCCAQSADSINIVSSRDSIAANNEPDTVQGGRLQEVVVWDKSSFDRALQLSEKEKINMKLNNAPRGFNILGPIFWAVDKYIVQKWKKNHPSRKERAKRLVEMYGQQDDLLMEAYKKTMKEMEEKKKRE